MENTSHVLLLRRSWSDVDGAWREMSRCTGESMKPRFLRISETSVVELRCRLSLMMSLQVQRKAFPTRGRSAGVPSCLVSC